MTRQSQSCSLLYVIFGGLIILALPVHAKSLDESAKITLACLLGGVPALGILMMFALCLWIRKRKRDLRRIALQNGIELDADGWPVDRSIRVTDNLRLETHGTASEITAVADQKGRPINVNRNYHQPTAAPVHANSLDYEGGRQPLGGGGAQAADRV